jgi:2-phospho-L-lactate guanylyltransferase (CobY/MobA/RfbA family)
VTTAIGVMARAPSSGGKTRLAPHLSPSRLAALRSALLADALGTFATVPDVTIFFTPDEAEREIAALAGPARRLVAQGGGDLGARMLRASRRSGHAWWSCGSYNQRPATGRC